jgi:outer membrane protein OmpU
MNKWKKLGVSALCGTLASVSAANAGDFGVKGHITATHSTADDDEATGNPLGMSRDFNFYASGEMDNGTSWNYNALYTADTATLSSTQLTFAMDGIGSVQLAMNNTSAVMGIDDVMPSAYEEAWGNGISSGIDLVAGAGTGNLINFTTAAGMLPFGSSIMLSYTPKNEGTRNADKAASTATTQPGSATGIRVTTSPVDGLTIAAAYAERENGETGTANTYLGDSEDMTAYIKYAAGPVTLGYQQTYEDLNIRVNTGVSHYEGEAFGVSFQVNDNLSISYGEHNSTKVNGTAANVELETKGLNAAYNMGGATLKLSHSEADNVSYINTANTVGGNDDSHTVLAIGMAF